jgi:fatty acid desaturase
MAGMEQELRRPDYTPRKHDRAASAFNCAMAAIGLTFMTLSLVGGNQTSLFVLAAIVAIPVLWLSIWTAGRAWHLERRLSEGRDVDSPVFGLLHYFNRKT